MNISVTQWSLINEIVLRIHNGNEIGDMQKDFMTVVKALIDYDMAVFYVAEGDDYLANAYSVGLTDADIKNYRDNMHDHDPFRPLMGILADSHGAIRASDYSSNEEIQKTEYYKKVWEPKGIQHTVYMPLSENGVWLGSVSFFRSEDKGEFTDNEVEVANVLMAHLQIRLNWNRRERERHVAGNMSQEEAGKVREALVNEYSLTQREAEVVSLWVSGLTDAEICEELSISKNTLKKHISNLFGKLDIGNRVELIKLIANL